MESINNANNINIELTKQRQLQHRIRKVLKKSLRAINNMLSIKSSKKIVIELNDNVEIDDNNFNEMLERRAEDRQNLLNEQIMGHQQQQLCIVESDSGKFYWSAEVRRFIAYNNSEAKFDSNQQQAQIQCCWRATQKIEIAEIVCDNRENQHVCDIQPSLWLFKLSFNELTQPADLSMMMRKLLDLTIVFHS